MGTTTENPWGGFVEADRLFGEYWFVERYRQAYWAIGGILLVLLPPVGAFMLAYMLGNSVFHEDTDIEAEIQPD